MNPEDNFPNNQPQANPNPQPQVIQPQVQQPPIEPVAAAPVPVQEQPLQPMSVQPQQQISQPDSPQPVTPQPASQYQASVPVEPQQVMPQQPQVAMPVPPQQMPAQSVAQQNMGMPPIAELSTTMTMPKKTRQLSKNDKLIGYFLCFLSLVMSVGVIPATNHFNNVRAEKIAEHDPYRGDPEDVDAVRQKGIEESKPEVQEPINGELDLSKLFDAPISGYEQNITAEIGQQVNTSNGMSFIVTGFQRGWDHASIGERDKPPRGKEFVFVDVIVGYRGKTDTGFALQNSFSIENKNGALIEPATSFIGAELPYNGLDEDASELAPGKSVKGYALFKVNIGEPISLVYDTPGWDHELNEYPIYAKVELK